ncbi:hypothetical protein BDV93DRAFT_519490 [Ceratobasidium sp. AG-I]|nr:hypothetical protein BDV93DRAFT_519490 [Ceratobasidium sp. AG-I]
MPTPHLDPTVVDELRRAVKGAVYHRDDSGFVRHSQLFNAAIRSPAQLLVGPLHAQDVSEIVKFCARHGLNPSVKSGGYGTHGWAVEGDVILDMRMLSQITIERPDPSPVSSAPDWTPLHEVGLTPVSDPDTFKGKNRMPSVSAYPSAYPANTVGPPALHVPFTEPRRRTAEEAFVEPTVVVEREDAMPVDGGNDRLRSSSADSSGPGSADGEERPSRRLRVTSSASGHTSHGSSISTPPVHSPHTPADGILPPTVEKGNLERTDSVSSHKIYGPATSTEVEHDEGFLPPTSDRPAVGIDGRGFVGRDLGGWHHAWDGVSRAAPTESESVGASFALGMGVSPAVVDTDASRGIGSHESIMSAVGSGSGSMGASSWLWAPPAANPVVTTSPLPNPTSPPRSNAPPSARPFDFTEPTGAPAQINAHANPHSNPGSHAGALFPGMGNTLFGVSGSGGHRPFDFGPPPPAPSADALQTSSSSILRGPTPSSFYSRTSAFGFPHTSTPPTIHPSEESTSTTPVPTVTHVDFAPGPPVPHTYVTFGAGASQKDIDTFCASHPLEAVTARVSNENESPVSAGPGVDGDGKDEREKRVVADSARPELYVPPSGSGLGPREGSFFAPGGMSPAFGQPSTSQTNLSSGPAPGIPYYVPFAAHPVGSTVMLLGGFGFLSRLRGLSMDCMVEAEVVLPDGRIVWVSKEGVRGEDGELIDEGEDEWEESGDGEVVDGKEADVKGESEGDKGKEKELEEKGEEKESTPTPEGERAEKPKRGLWWAMRGAGPAFGIVVRYKARAFPVPVVFAGNLIYNFNKLTAASLIKHFRDCIKAAPRELYANCILTAGPRGKGALVVIQICYAGPRAEGLPFLQAISSWEGEGCLLNEVQEKAFVWQQDSVAKVLKGGSGRKWFIRSDLITSLTDEIIHQTVRKFGDTPDGCTWLFELSGGALVDTTDSCLPKCAREATFTIVALHQWKLEDNDPACVLTAEEWIRNTLMPQSTGGPFPCFLERRETRSRILGVYGAQNWARLCTLKKKYDPNGMLRHNLWPLDEEGKPILDVNLMKVGNGGEKPAGHKMDMTLDDRGVPLPA